MFQPVEHESYTTVVHAIAQDFLWSHQIRQYGYGSNHVACHQDVDEFGQRGTEKQNVVTRLHAHALHDSSPQVNLLYEFTALDVSAKIDDGVVTVIVGQYASFDEFP